VIWAWPTFKFKAWAMTSHPYCYHIINKLYLSCLKLGKQQIYDLLKLWHNILGIHGLMAHSVFLNKRRKDVTDRGLRTCLGRYPLNDGDVLNLPELSVKSVVPSAVKLLHRGTKLYLPAYGWPVIFLVRVLYVLAVCVLTMVTLVTLRMGSGQVKL